MKHLSLIVVLCIVSACGAESPKPGFHNETYTPKDGSPAKYVLFVPHKLEADAKPPIILFLHGSGGTGDDGEKHARGGIAKAIRTQERTFPFIVVIPQSQKRTWSADSEDGKRALAILAEVEKKYHTDPSRVYLTGLSMGGFGTWSMAAAHPKKWAAIAPICGGGNPKSAAAIKDIPCWCFHGDADPTVKVDRSRQMIDAVKEAGGKPKYTEYPGVDHNSWDKAYGTKELYSWMLEHKLK